MSKNLGARHYAKPVSFTLMDEKTLSDSFRRKAVDVKFDPRLGKLVLVYEPCYNNSHD